MENAIFKEAGYFPSSSASALCGLKPKPMSNPELTTLKRRILEYLRAHDGNAFISDLSSNLHEEPRRIILALTELKEESQIL